MAVESAGPYANPPLSCFYRPDALPLPNQQRQSTEGKHSNTTNKNCTVPIYISLAML